jgi:hypothetical protein
MEDDMKPIGELTTIGRVIIEGNERTGIFVEYSEDDLKKVVPLWGEKVTVEKAKD